MKVSTEIDNNFGYEKITQLVDNIPLSLSWLAIAKFSIVFFYDSVHKAAQYFPRWPKEDVMFKRGCDRVQSV
jgi:hypothetical protein